MSLLPLTNIIFVFVFTDLPSVTWLGQTISARHTKLVSVGGIASEAAAVVIESGKLHNNNIDWPRTMCVEKARNIPRFEGFMGPRKFTKLANAARSGPVVVINVHKSRCDALIVMAAFNEVTLKCRHLYARHLMVSTKLDDAGFEGILSSLWTIVVKPVLDAYRSFDPSRIWWCATDPFTFLPIHAAGLYNTRDAGFKISDFVISSYTPTLTALLEPPLIAHRAF
ncbi:hypothetical protein PILCRDRAFT_6509 [Piloderma croceum F 1598]|uniref:Uncharacterized protein n=1 Tax=Piloderma croceum (strain F 1598) TaxID=765440 RepID=A0A0C3G0N8_PILCF|nr:hypothetical protein PILCRDRAFT_6509 [Piloderma croceum F 1598]